jgi:hypothetical protein
MRADAARRAGLNRTLGLSDELFVLVDSVLLTGLGRVMLMPTLVLAARICPEARPPAPCAVSRGEACEWFSGRLRMMRARVGCAMQA